MNLTITKSICINSKDLRDYLKSKFTEEELCNLQYEPDVLLKNNGTLDKIIFNEVKYND